MSLAQDRRNCIASTGLEAHAVDLYLRAVAGAGGICKVGLDEIRADLGCRQLSRIRQAVAELCASAYPDGTPYLLHDPQTAVFYFPKSAADCPPRTRAHYEARLRYANVPACEPRRVFLAELSTVAGHMAVAPVPLAPPSRAQGVRRWNG
jgi:hypothetical protein